jgi:NAD(P)-dependent dehydrogenase (short-subunit alcohol dehydrogenase family)
MAKGTYHVFLCSRTPEKGAAALKGLQAANLSGTAEAITLDVTDDATINAAFQSIQQSHGRLDILVNNAAVAIVPGENSVRERMQKAFDTNATGPAVITQTFGPLLHKSQTTPRIINVSSGIGSIQRRFNKESPFYRYYDLEYRASKCALSMVTANQYAQYADSELGAKVFAYDPGFTVSNLGPQNNKSSGARDVSESVRPLVDVLEGKRDGENGKFLHNTGVYEW